MRLALGWYHQGYHRGVARFAKEAGWHLWTGRRLHTMIHEGWTGDGFITNGLFPEEWKILFTLPEVALVSIDHFPIHRDRTARIRVDHQAVGVLALEHFRQRGFENFAWFSRYKSHEFQRAEAFEQAAEAGGYHCHAIAWFEHRGQTPAASERRQDWLRRKVSELPTPVAILAVNDEEAVDLLDACDDIGLAVPEQVAIMGVGNTEEICDYTRVPLTSIDINREECGYQAAALLKRLMDGEHIPEEQPVIVPLKGVAARHSTDIVAVGHVEVARAVRFIWDNIERNIGVDNVVDAVALSRRSLFSAFRRYLGRSPHQEILRRRLEVTKRLLRETDLKVNQIYSRAGFASITHLYQVFKREVKMTPRQYRLSHRGRKPEVKAAAAEN
ncbi:MAG: substrate-binding domain-containing protein [Phycisphaerae bacterium]